MDADENGFLVGPRIEFPSGLEKLDLSFCGIHDLQIFRFPSSIKYLILSSNAIEDLKHYEPTFTSESVYWQELKNLEELHLKRNLIKSLNCWLPPPSLKVLDLYLNKFDEIDPEQCPIFQERFYNYSDNLRSLNLQLNSIQKVPRNLVFPRNLLRLNLSDNFFHSFEFTDAIASHENLTSLDISAFEISRISLEMPQKQYSMNLQALIITNKFTELEMTPEEFREVISRLGLPRSVDESSLRVNYRVKEETKTS